MIPIALSSSLSESSSFSPAFGGGGLLGKEGEREDQAPLLLPKTTYSPSTKVDPRERKLREKKKTGRSVVQGMAPLEGVPSSDSVVHESLLPSPLVLGQEVKGRKKKEESGWWGPLASVIGRSRGEFDPGNVV